MIPSVRGRRAPNQLAVTVMASLALCACRGDKSPTPQVTPVAPLAAAAPTGGAAQGLGEAAGSVAPSAPTDTEPPCTITTPLKPGVPGSPGHLIASPINPNGDSELSHLMRQMTADLRAARDALRGGAAPEPAWAANHRRIRCAWPTDPGVRTGHYDALAGTYLAAVRAYERDPAPARYEAVVRACATCHEHTCDGPLMVIESLHLDDR